MSSLRCSIPILRTEEYASSCRRTPRPVCKISIYNLAISIYRYISHISIYLLAPSIYLNYRLTSYTTWAPNGQVALNRYLTALFLYLYTSQLKYQWSDSIYSNSWRQVGDIYIYTIYTKNKYPYKSKVLLVLT